MTLPTLRVEQHAQILGFSIIGYGIANIIELIGPFIQARQVSSILDQRSSTVNELTSKLGEYSTKITASPSIDLESYLWPKILLGFALFLLCVVTGIVISGREINPRVLGLTLAVIIFGFFPLGTLLSVYILIYLFVIDTGEYNSEPTVNTVHLNG